MRKLESNCGLIMILLGIVTVILQIIAGIDSPIPLTVIVFTFMFLNIVGAIGMAIKFDKSLWFITAVLWLGNLGITALWI